MLLQEGNQLVSGKIKFATCFHCLTPGLTWQTPGCPPSVWGKFGFLVGVSLTQLVRLVRTTGTGEERVRSDFLRIVMPPPGFNYQVQFSQIIAPGAVRG